MRSAYLAYAKSSSKRYLINHQVSMPLLKNMQGASRSRNELTGIGDCTHLPESSYIAIDVPGNSLVCYNTFIGSVGVLLCEKQSIAPP